ncbi:MAG TPA: hypothetical protein VG126_04300 [Thermoleophilaceae bacterium]|nr:hypothetical protein [Thermoleophilaceae bacterium]
MEQTQELLVVVSQIDHEEEVSLSRGAEVRLSSHEAGQEREELVIGYGNLGGSGHVVRVSIHA